MSIKRFPELSEISDRERIKILHPALIKTYKNPRVWSLYLAFTIVYIAIFHIAFTHAQPRLVLILAYSAVSLFFINKIVGKIHRENIASELKTYKEMTKSTPKQD
ncbi:MAG: hypothetical protein U1F46_13990 [Marinagarivorans sp.]